MYIPITRRGNYMVMESSGVDLNFEVAASTTEPSSPNENTLWVYTDMPISSFEINSMEPENPEENMLWIKNSASSNIDINISNEETPIVIYIQDCYLYQSGEWISVDSKVYQSGEWVSSVLKVYYYGDQNVDLTGGWVTVNNFNVTIQYQDAQIYISGESGDDYSKTFSVKTSKAIDVTDYNTLRINQDWITKNSPFGDNVFGLFTNQSDDYKKAVASVTNPEAYIIDISNITGSYYIGFAGHFDATFDNPIQTMKVYIKEVVLSK